MDKINAIDLKNVKDYYSYCNIRALFRAYYNSESSHIRTQIKNSIGYIIRDKIGKNTEIIKEYYNIVKQSFKLNPISNYRIENYDINTSKNKRNEFSDKYYDYIKDMCVLMEIIEMVERDIQGAYRHLFLESENTALSQSQYDNISELFLPMSSKSKTGGNNMKKRLLKKYI